MRGDFLPLTEPLFNRHDLVWLDGTRARDALAEHPHAAELEGWLRAGLPFVVCRADQNHEAPLVSLGVHFPPGGNSPGERVGFTVPMSCVRDISPPPNLVKVMRYSRDGWKRALGLLIEQDPFFSDFRVYGSHMWQLLTGRGYVREASDIDLAMPVRSPEEILRIGLCLNAWEEATGLTADGEFIFPGGSAVAWRECVSTPRSSLLLKSISSVRLCEPDDLFSLFDNGQRVSR